MAWDDGVKPHPTFGLFLMFFVVMDHFANDEVQELLGKFGVEIGLKCHALKPFNLLAFAQRIRRGQNVFCLELTYSLGVFEPLGQRIDKHRIQPINAVAVVFQKLSSDFGMFISQRAFLSV